MGRQFKHYLEPSALDLKKVGQVSGVGNGGAPANSAPKTIYVCKYCKSHLALASQLISRSFHGKTGAAYLFQKAVNVFKGPESEKEMMTGKHIVADIYCNSCAVIIGWTYVSYQSTARSRRLILFQLKAYQED